MSDERREAAWRKWWGDRGFNPAHHLAFNEGWEASEAEVETKLDAAQEAYRLQEQRHIAIRRLAEDANTSLIDENIRLKAELMKVLADWVCDQDGRYCFSHHRPWPCPEEGRDEATLAEIDASLEAE